MFHIELKWGPIKLYRNDELIISYAEMHGIDRNDAEKLFEKTKRFLYLKCKGTPIELTDEIDSMWNFFTKRIQDYISFCDKYFGKLMVYDTAHKNEDVSIKLSDNTLNQEGLGEGVKITQLTPYGEFVCLDEEK